MLLTGKLPFDGENDNTIMREIRKCQIDYENCKELEHVS